jgi:hypothetical protein
MEIDCREEHVPEISEAIDYYDPQTIRGLWRAVEQCTKLRKSGILTERSAHYINDVYTAIDTFTPETIDDGFGLAVIKSYVSRTASS